MKNKGIHEVWFEPEDIEINENETKQSDFIKIANNKNINAMSKIVKPNKTNVEIKKDEINNTETLIVNRETSFILEEIGLKQVTQKTIMLVDFLTEGLLANNSYKQKENVNPKVSFSLECYAKRFGRKYNSKYVRTALRKELTEEFSRLQSMKIVIKKEDGGEVSLSLASGYNTSGKTMSINLDIDLAVRILNSSLTKLPKTSFLDNENYELSKKLSTHYHLESNIKKGNNNILSVKTLLEASRTKIPSYDDVMSSNRAWKKRIVNKLDESLNEISKQQGIEWEYCLAKKEPFKLQIKDIKTYDDFLKLYVKYEYKND